VAQLVVVVDIVTVVVLVRGEHQQDSVRRVVVLGARRHGRHGQGSPFPSALTENSRASSVSATSTLTRRPLHRHCLDTAIVTGNHLSTSDPAADRALVPELSAKLREAHPLWVYAAPSISTLDGVV
jgi:hypothetical protein